MDKMSEKIKREKGNEFYHHKEKNVKIVFMDDKTLIRFRLWK